MQVTFLNPNETVPFRVCGQLLVTDDTNVTAAYLLGAGTVVKLGATGPADRLTVAYSSEKQCYEMRNTTTKAVKISYVLTVSKDTV